MGTTIKIHINWQFLEAIKIEREVHQGCPIALMIFALSTQPLRDSINNKRNNGQMTSIPITDNLSIYKRLFDDDIGLLIPCHWTTYTLRESKHASNSTSLPPEPNSTSQVHNYTHRSPPNSFLASKQRITNYPPRTISTYLGAPIGVNLSPTQIIDFYVDRVWKCISSWKTRTNSFTDRIILIK